MSVESRTTNRLAIDIPNTPTRDEYVGLALVFALAVADLLITYYAFTHGVPEANPFARGLIETYGEWILIPFKGLSITLLAGAYLAVLSVFASTRARLWFLYALAAPLTFLIIRNAMLVRVAM